MNREETIFEHALGIDSPADRDAWLREACAGDEPMFQSLQGLLRVHDRAGKFLDPGPEESLNQPLEAALGAMPLRNAEKPGDRIGRYKLLEKIGEGGCGVVYMAEQEEPVRRRVALKVIKLGMDTEAVIARFEAERQALALMDHPNIAKVFDAGVTDSLLPASGHPLPSTDEGRGQGEGSSLVTRHSSLVTSPGRPYFVMELVRGSKITEFCDHNNLTTPQRLDLFMQVCRAIQHAHQKGIIHRDIKPSNILVTLHDRVPVPKVIDFGIAKATQGRLTDKTVFTAFQQFIGTPAYMSPEQAEMTSLDIDTRSDIYSLGVLLYELLTGKPPFESKDLLEAGLDAMRRTIRETEPQRPSTKLSTMAGGELTITANRRQTEPPKLVHAVRGDLDWIVMKCLEKDRARRYETAIGLASDLQRHLSNEPVTACPPSNLYRLRKTLRRHQGAFAAAATILVLLSCGVGASTWEAHRARRAEQEQARLRQEAEANESRALANGERARTEAARNVQIVRFFEEMLLGIGPEVAKGRDATILKEILDKTAQRIGTELTNQPEVESDIRDAAGKIYRALGDYENAEVMQRRVVSLERLRYPNGHGDLAKVLDDLATTLMLRGNLPEAEALGREAVAMGKKLLGPVNSDVATFLNDLANILKHEGNLDEAEAMYRDALAVNRELLGNEHREVAVTLNNLATLAAKRGKLDQAETLELEALQIGRKLWGNEHPMLARFLITLTWILSHEDKLPEAERAGLEAVALQEKLSGPDNPDVANALGNLADVLERQGKLQEAEAAQRRALSIRRKSLSGEHPILALSLHDLGTLLNSRGKRSEAEANLREALAMARKLPRSDYVNATNILADLNQVLAAEGKPPETSQ